MSPVEEQKPIVKVCTHTKCQSKGSKEIFDTLRAELYDEALVLKYPHCFDHCENGPNVSVNGQVLHHVNNDSAVSQVRNELKHPSPKSDGPGTRPIGDLDEVLDEATRLS